LVVVAMLAACAGTVVQTMRYRVAMQRAAMGEAAVLYAARRPIVAAVLIEVMMA
jgi:hypothetical protein